MTQYFDYNSLSFPEIEALRRDTPLVIPLGSGYDLERLAEALGNPARAGLLPPLPFGWEGSGLKTPEDVLRRLLLNLVDSLREDGFSRVYALTPQGLALELGAQGIALYHPCQGRPADPLPPDTRRDRVIVIPVGHTEQHALHLPVMTDAAIIEAVGLGTMWAAPERAYTLPMTPYGVSTHRQAFAGTLSCGGRAFEDFWLAIADVLVARGFDQLFFINGHGGNHSFLVNVVKYAGERHRRAFIATTWLYLTSGEAYRAIEELRQSPIGGMGHACELETALMLHLRPELVHMEKAVDETDFIATPNYYMDWVEGGALIANPPWDDDTRTGAYGAGSLGTAEKGRLWLEAAVREKVGQVEEIHQQQERRERRREAGFGLWGKAKR